MIGVRGIPGIFRFLYGISPFFVGWAIAAGLLWPAGSARAGAPVPERVTVFDRERSFLADGSRGPYRISRRAIFPESERVWVDGELQRRGVDYRLDAGEALLVFSRGVSRGARVLVRFRQAPQVLGEVYRRREVEAPEAQEASRPVRRVPPPGHAGPESGAEPGLEIGGSKRIQVGIGGNRDAELNQSLQVHISGEIAEGVELTALLSDQNLPLQASGRTQSLQELDRVMFQVRARSLSAGLGDMDVVFDETTFGRYHRRLQGANLALSTGEAEARVYGAVSRGRWNSHRLAVVEGYQGPYPLPAKAGGVAGEVVAGSERVYVNGRLLRRGEGQDYVMDYERGTITFTPSWPVGGESRVLVEFQHVDGAQRRLLGFGGRMGVADGRLKLGATFLRETDRAGDPALEMGGPQGSRKQVAVLDGTYLPLDGLTLDGEIALSASGEEGAGQGRAFRLGVDFWPEAVRVAGRSLGRVRLSGSYRDVGATFSGFERTERIDREGRWGWQEEGTGERAGEVRMEYTPRRGLRLDAGYGRRTGRRTAVRQDLGVRVSDRGGPDAGYRYEAIDQGDGEITRHRGEISGHWWLFRPGFRFASETATGEAVAGSALFYAGSPIGGMPEGMRVREAGWEVAADLFKTLSWKSELEVRRTRVLEEVWQDSIRSWSHRHEASVSGWGGLSVAGEVSHSRVRYAGGLEDRNTDLGRVRLGYSKGAFSQQVSYRISSTGTPDREPVFVYVGPGRGTHLWEDIDGDAARDPEEFVPDPEGEYERFYGPGGGFKPVRSAALLVRLEVVFKRVLRAASSAWMRALAGLSLDLSLEADREALPGAGGVAPWDLYGFRKGPEVQSGMRDALARLYLFRYSRGASFRISARDRRRLDRSFVALGLERLSSLALLGRFGLGPGLDLEAEVSAGRREREGEEVFAYEVRERAALLRAFWRVNRGWQTSLEVQAGRDREAFRELTATRFSLRPEVIRALTGRGRMRAYTAWTYVAAPERLPLFLGLAQGDQAGQNLSWQCSVDYRMGRYLTAYVSYDGRIRPGRPVLHMGRMEMRAVF